MDDERQALLDFKHGLIDEANRLASWVPEKKDCCTWTGIVCDNITGHVNSVHLRANEYSNQRLSGRLSPSLLNLKQIKHLDLSGNAFRGIKLPSFMGSLGNLRYLNLSRSGFGGPIPPQLGNLTELRILSLQGFYVYDTDENEHTSMTWLSNLRLLHHLDMSGVDLSKATDWLQVINTLPSLVELHLSNCQLSYTHPHVPGLNLTSLSILDLSYNYFTNSSVPRWIFSQTGLVSLDLTACDFHGLNPGSSDGFHNMTSLELLRVPKNNFMSSSLVLEGLSGIGGNLILLDISACGISSSVLVSLHNLTSLHSLDMSGNQLTETIPKSLGNLCNLKHIDMGGNYFANISLTSLLESLFECKSPSVESLSLESTGLSCSLPDQLGQLMYLVHFQLGNNSIVGVIPDSIGRLSFLRSLDLHENLILGPIPYSIGRLSSLEMLDLSSNRLNGSVPDSIGQLSKLDTLILSSNSLTGNITEAHFATLTSLMYLYGEGNNLALRSHISNWIPSFHLVHVSLNSWDLGPQFPLWLQQQTNLVTLEMSNTRISTTIPEWFWNSLPNLGYHATSIGGSVGSASLVIKGREDTYASILGLVMMLDLSSNKFSGIIPHELMSLRALQSLNLSRNQLTGMIPQNIGDLKSLVSFDVSVNSISGELPMSLSSLSFLSSFNVSFNNLTGKVPSSTQFQTFNESGFLGNKLCGYPLTKSCAIELPADREQDEEENDGADWGLIISIVSGFIVGFWVVLAPLMGSKTWRITYFGFLSDTRFMFCDAFRNYCCNMFHKY